MQDIAAKISDSELEVLEVLWEAEEALPIAPIRKRLEERRGWDISTIKTLLRRLCEKGAVEARRRESFYYRPLLDREDYQRWSTRSLIQPVSRWECAMPPVMAMASTAPLTRTETAAIPWAMR